MRYALALVGILGAGLASRSALAVWLPPFVHAYAGDTLWAMAVFFGLAFGLPRTRGWHLALLGLAFSWSIEFLQLYQAPWLNDLRATRLGGLVLGFGFLWSDLICYTVGILLAAILDRLLQLPAPPARKPKTGDLDSAKSFAPLALRPARKADQAAVQRLVFTVLEEYGLAPAPATTDADLQALEETYAGRGGRFEVLVDHRGRILGTVGLYPLGETTVELRKMYLDRSVRGRGLGRRMLQHALDQAATLGFERVVLETSSVLREAIQLYERAGFRPYRPRHLAARCDAAYELELPRSERAVRVRKTPGSITQA